MLLVRRPCAVLSGYRRMGWSPDLDEIAPLALEHLGEGVRPSGDDATDTAVFRSTLHRLALLDLRRTGAVVVFHEDLAMGGTSALEALFHRCGLDWNLRVAASTGAAWERKPSPTSSAAGATARLRQGPAVSGGRLARACLHRRGRGPRPSDACHVEQAAEPATGRIPLKTHENGHTTEQHDEPERCF